MIATIVLILTSLIFLLVLFVVTRAIASKQQLIRRPPDNAFFFILANILVVVNLAFLLLNGLMERVLINGLDYKLNEESWKGDPDGRVPLLKIMKAMIMQPTFLNKKVYGEKGLKAAMEKTIDDWSLKYPGIEKVDHLYFHSILSVSPETRKYYLEIAYLKGKDQAY